MKKSIVVVLLGALLQFNATVWAESLFSEGAPAGVSDVINKGAYPDFTMLAKALSPAVVNIAVEGGAGEEAEEELPKGLPPGFPFFKKEPEAPTSSLGSGFIVRADGFIVTNNHVVRDAKKIIVRLLDDRTEYEAKVIGIDQLTDLALLKIEAGKPLAVAYLGDSDAVEVGEWVLAIGNQFQLGQTVTAGIVSAKSRRVGGGPSRPYDQFIQTDAPINPGSSGGPLFSTKGQVIGINTAIFSPGRMPQMGGSGFNIGIGFAIPINLVNTIINQLKETGKVTRGLLGVLIQEIDPDLQKALKLPSLDGALVSEVKKDSPAERAGFKRRDVILSYNGHPIKDHSELPLQVANTKIGSDATIEVWRDGKKLTLTPRVGEMKAEAESKDKSDKPKADELGLVVKDLSEEQAKALGITRDSGVIVESVEPGSAADEARLMRGDVIQELGEILITKSQSFEDAVKNMARKAPVSLLVKRKDGSFYLTITAK